MNASSFVVPLCLLAGILVGAFLVHRIAPRKRHNIRRLVVLLALVVVGRGIESLLLWLGEPVWAGRVGMVAWTTELFATIQLVALFVLDLGFAFFHVELPRIVGDLLVGLAYFITSLSVLREVGVELGPVLAGGAIVSAVLALSLQPTLGNLLGGVALQLDGSIHVGDWIVLENGKQGRVRDIRWRHTTVETRDWSTLVVPNAVLLASTITILGRRDGGPVPYRLWVYFHVDFRFAPSQVCQVVEDGLRGSPIALVASAPPPQCVCMDFAREGRDSYALYAVRFWLTDLAQDDGTASAVRMRVWAALKRASIPLARPTRTLFMNDDRVYHEQRETRHQGERLQALEAVELFRGLTDEERADLASHLVRVPYVQGERITRQGAIAHWLYVLCQGEADIQLRLENGESRKVSTLSAPSFFGEMGLMTGEPRMADVVATTDVTCFRLDKASFESIVQTRPELATEFSQVLAHRRVDLLAIRDGLDEKTRKAAETSEASRILGKIRDFFGLDA